MMKKMLKSSIVAMLMFVMLFALAGCGEDKLVGTLEEGGMKMEIEITFKKDVANKVKMSFEAESEDQAKEGKEYFEEAFGGDGVSVKQSGKKIVIEMDIKTFLIDWGGVSESEYEKEKDTLTKDNLRGVLEEMGCDIK